MTNIVSLDPNLVEEGFNSLAKVFTCQKCNKLPLDQVQCKNKKCEKMICIDCHSSPNEKCSGCGKPIDKKSVTGNLYAIFGLIKIKCLKGCSSNMEIKNLKSHLKICEGPPKPKEQPTPGAGESLETSMKDLMKDYEEFKKFMELKKQGGSNITPVLDNDETEKKKKEIKINIEKDGKMLELKRMREDSPDELDFKSSNFLKNATLSDLDNLDNSKLKKILDKRNLPTSGNKGDLIARIMKFRSKMKAEDDMIKKMIDTDEILMLPNDHLEHLLEMRGVKKGGNKEEKIKNLTKYLIS